MSITELRPHLYRLMLENPSRRTPQPAYSRSQAPWRRKLNEIDVQTGPVGPVESVHRQETQAIGWFILLQIYCKEVLYGGPQLRPWDQSQGANGRAGSGVEGWSGRVGGVVQLVHPVLVALLAQAHVMPAQLPYPRLLKS
jgi:hypothetical protein